MKITLKNKFIMDCYKDKIINTITKYGFGFEYSYPHTYNNYNNGLQIQLYLQCIEVRLITSNKLLYCDTLNLPMDILLDIITKYGRKNKIKKIIQNIHGK